MKNDFQKQQLQIITRIDGHDQSIQNMQSDLTVTRNIGETLTDEFDNFDQKLNKTQEMQLELASQIRNHGHGNKQRIENLESQITNFKNDFQTFDRDLKTVQQKQIELISREDVLHRRMNVLWTNITFYMNRIERQAIDNITDLSSQMNTTNSVRLSRIRRSRLL